MARSRSTIERSTGAHLTSIKTVRDWIRPLKAVTTFVTARGDPQTRRTHSAMSWPSLTVRMVSTVSTTARSTIRIRNASGLRDRLSSYAALRHPGPQKTRGRPVPAAGGRVAPHRMHRVEASRLMVVFCTSLIVGRCAKLPRFVTDEIGGSSICKRRGNRRGAAIGPDDHPPRSFHHRRTLRVELQHSLTWPAVLVQRGRSLRAILTPLDITN
jgi:hypothetical protein